MGIGWHRIGRLFMCPKRTAGHLPSSVLHNWLDIAHRLLLKNKQNRNPSASWPRTFFEDKQNIGRSEMRADVAVSSLNITSAPVLEEFPYFVFLFSFHICLHQEIYIVTCLPRRSKTNKLTCEMIGFVGSVLAKRDEQWSKWRKDIMRGI